MFDKYKIDIKWVQSEEEWEELSTAVHNAPLKQSPFLSYDAFERCKGCPVVNFYNVYYESTLIGYMFLNERTLSTSEFHWGVVAKHKYLMGIIRESFHACKAMGIKNFLGTIPVDNKSSIKIAKRLGFTALTILNEYCDDGTAVLLVNYEVK